MHPLVTDQRIFDGNSQTETDVQIGVPKLSIGLLAALIPGLSAPQKRDLARVIERLRREMKEGLGPFDFNAVKAEIMKDQELILTANVLKIQKKG